MQVRKPLLGRVRMTVLLVVAKAVECLGSENTNYCAEDIRLFVVKVYEICRFPLNVIDCAPYGPKVETGGKGNGMVKIILSNHSRSVLQ